MSLSFMTMGFVMVIISRNSAERIVEVLNEKPALTSPENALTEVKDGSVEFDHVSFRYSSSGNKDVLHDINLKIPSGSSLGIIGATGSSKSTLVSMIARLYDVSSGSVRVGGEDVRKYDLVTLRDSVAMVLQKNTLFTGTIASNLRWGNENATDEELMKACDIAQASEFVNTFPKKLESPIDEGGTNVSGGQKQRLCIARALLKKPKILILDDSTSAVDTHTDSLIREGFKKELPEMTRIIIAQRILSIKDCDQIAIIDNGKIVALGTSEELLKTSQEYQELYNTQLGGGGDFDVE
jgi:ATP-binding cassette subfamily B protein